MKRKTTLYLTRASLIAALYTTFTYLTSFFGLASGAIQFRISEMLCILPVFFPEAILGLTVGCFLANILTASVIWDIIFGTLATLIGAIGAYLLRFLPSKLIFLATVPTILANTLIVPLVIIYAYGAQDAYFYLVLTVGIGEIVCAGIMGTSLYYSLYKSRIVKPK